MANVKDMSSKTTIAVTRETYDLLKKQGCYGDTMDQIIRRILGLDKREN
jgi:hypothetical protein